MPFRAVFLRAVFVIGVVISPACIPDPTPALDNATTQAVAAIDKALMALDQNSSDWQVILQNLPSQLSGEARNLINGPISDLLNRGIAAAGSEVSCRTDFLQQRVKQDLLNLRAQLLGLSEDYRDPWLCDLVPPVVDVTRVQSGDLKALEIYGFDFDAPGVQAFIVNTAGTTDVTAKLAHPTNYLMTLPFGGNGVQLNSSAQQLKLVWRDQSHTISVLQPSTPVCQTQTPPPVPINDVTFIPPLVSGDREFGGNGPHVWASVVVTNKGDRVDAMISMTAIEEKNGKSGDTAAKGTTTAPVYVAPNGFRIDSLSGAVNDSFSYIDSNNDDESFSRPSGGPVAIYKFTGDSKGDDAGINTKVTVTFNPLRLGLKQVGNCVSPLAVSAAIKASALGSIQLNRLQPTLLTPIPGLNELETTRFAPTD